MRRNLVNFVTFLDIGCWAVCFWWVHRISQRQDAMLKELHPTVQKIEKGVDQVKESTQA